MNEQDKKVPTLRFKGFTNDWEQHKLGDIANIGDGLHGTPKYDANGKYHFINGNNLIDGKIQITKETKRVSYSALSDYDKSLDNLTLLMSINGTIGQLAFYNKEPIKLGKSVAYIRFGNLSTLSFYYGALMASNTQQYFNRRVTGTTIKNLGLNEIRNFKYPIPSETEQKKIGKLIKLLNATITLQQRKLELLKQLKKGFLQKMFPKNGAKVPELRFAGFADDWEVRKLKDVLDISKTKNKAQQYGKADVLSVSREVGTVNQIKYKGRSFAGSDLSNYKVVQGGELIYTKSPLKGAPYGIFQVATIKGILSPLYAVYTSTDKAYTPFVAMALKNDNIATHYLTPLVTKGAKNTINVTDEGALEGKIQFPSILEQKQIFIFFKQLDDSIVLQHQKLAKYQSVKKSLLQQMFI